MKKCSVCCKIKRDDEFYKTSYVKCGLRSSCKMCDSEMSRNYKRKMDGIVSITYSSHKRSSIQRNHPMPNYSKDEFREWLFSQSNFDMLYNNWVKSGYEKDLTPSCDRLDDYKPYTLDNLRLVTWKENREKHYSDVINGINNKANKAVVKLDLYGNFIEEYYSLHEACRHNDVWIGHVSSCCNNKRNNTGGYKWMFKEEWERKRLR